MRLQRICLALAVCLAVAAAEAALAGASAQEAHWVIGDGSDSTNIVLNLSGSVRLYRVCGPAGQAIKVRAGTGAAKGAAFKAEAQETRDVPPASCIDVEGAMIEVVRGLNEKGVLKGSYWRIR